MTQGLDPIRRLDCILSSVLTPNTVTHTHTLRPLPLHRVRTSLFSTSQAVNADPDCVQGSLLRHHDASEVWGRPLRDGSFVVVLLNKGDAPANVTLRPSYDAGGGDGAHCDLYDRIDIQFSL